MAKVGTRKALMAVLVPEDDDPRSVAAGRPGADTRSLSGLDERVNLFLRAMHGTRTATAKERASARLRILGAIADDLAGDSADYLAQSSQDFSAAAPRRAATKATAGSLAMLARFGDVLREALLWPLTMPGFAGQPMRLAAAAFATVLVAGGAWTATWFYAARTTETAIANWIDTEAKAGRDYSCGSRSTGGFPLRVEVSCTAPQAKVAMSDQSTFVVNAKSLRTVASVLHPGTLVANISGPISVNSSSEAATFVANWSLAQMIVHGQPSNPSQVSVVLDNPEVFRVAQGTDEHVMAGSRLEFSATASAGSIINIAAHGVDVSIPNSGPITSRPFVADVLATLHDVDNRTPQMLSARVRDWQSRGGHLEVAEARLQQGEAVASGTGEIRLSDSGRFDGVLHVSTVGLYQRLAVSFIRDGQSGARERERLAQSTLGAPRIYTRSLGAPQSEQPGTDAGPRGERPKQQVPPPQTGDQELPIRFSDGAVFVGSTGLGRIPPLF